MVVPRVVLLEIIREYEEEKTTFCDINVTNSSGEKYSKVKVNKNDIDELVERERPVVTVHEQGMFSSFFNFFPSFSYFSNTFNLKLKLK